MKRKLIIDGNAVYEIDEECMLKNRVDDNDRGRENTARREVEQTETGNREDVSPRQNMR